MKIPESVRISGLEYRVKEVPLLTDGLHELSGQIDYRTQTIKLSQAGYPKNGSKALTLWHEIIHGILMDRGLELDDDTEEAVCEAVARGVYQVLQDNADRFFDLYQPVTITQQMNVDKLPKQLFGIWDGGHADHDDGGNDDDDDDKDRGER